MKPALIHIENVHIHASEAQSLPLAIVHSIEARKDAPAQDAQRFVKYASGAPVADDAETWDAVLDNTTGLMWAAEDVEVNNWKAAEKACAELRTGDFEDWRWPTIQERLSIVDYTRTEPALDPAFFRVPGSDWHWTSTRYASAPSSHAWGVDLYDGGAYLDLQSYSGRVLACRRAARASQ